MKHSMAVVGVIVFAFLLIGGCQPESNYYVPSTTAAVATQRSSMETITVYSINSDTMSLIPVTAKKISDNNSPEYICSLILENLNEQDIQLSECSVQGKNVIVSFSSDAKPVSHCSAEMERLILDCFANSLLDNVESCEGVIFRCDDGAYKSQNLSFKKNEVYASE